MSSWSSRGMSWRSRCRRPSVVVNDTASRTLPLDSSPTSRLSPQNRGNRAPASITRESCTSATGSVSMRKRATEPSERAAASRLSLPTSCASNLLCVAGSATRAQCCSERSECARQTWMPSVNLWLQRRVLSRITSRNILPDPSRANCMRWHSLHRQSVRANERTRTPSVWYVPTKSESDLAQYATSFTNSPFGGVYASRASSRPVRTSNARTALLWSARNSSCAAAPPHSPLRRTLVSFGRQSESGGMRRARERRSMTRRAARTCHYSTTCEYCQHASDVSNLMYTVHCPLLSLQKTYCTERTI